jgi:small-conductance mechanosensitive channel
MTVLVGSDSTAWLDWTFWRGTLERSVTWFVSVLPAVVVILLGGYLALKATTFILRRLESILRRGHKSPDSDEGRRRVETLVSIASTALRSVLWAMLVLLVLVQLGIDIAPLIAGAGLVGLAIGFGAQELVRDVISGFFMLVENDVRRGDWAIINGTAGYVDSVTLRTIVLRDEAGVTHIFQNGKIESLSNTSKDWSAALVDVAISYDEDVDRAVGVMVRVGRELAAAPDFAPKLLSDLQVLGVDAFDDTQVVVRVRLKTRPLAQFEVGRELRKRLIKAFHEADIKMPEGSSTMHLVDITPQREGGSGLRKAYAS